MVQPRAGFQVASVHSMRLRSLIAASSTLRDAYGMAKKQDAVEVGWRSFGTWSYIRHDIFAPVAKRLRLLHGEIKTPPMSLMARREIGFLLRQIQEEQ